MTDQYPLAQHNVDQLDELQRRLAELTTIQRVARAINSTLDLDAIFQTVVIQINTAFNYQMVSIYLREGDGLRLQAYLGYDEVIEFIGLNQGVSGRVARTAQPVFVSDEACGPSGEEIVVAIGWERVDPTQAGAAELLADLAAGDYVFMEVDDSGPGMDQATQARMFEPFFTTKFTGRGLGLAAVQGIIRSHQGALRVWSAPQQGTRVRFWLPCSSDTHAHGDLTADQSARSTGMVDRAPASNIILVIDDEDGVRNVAARLLKRAGWTVLTAADGRAGIDVFQAKAHAIGCVLLDLTMPHMSGEQVFHELRRIRPDVRIILCSGYSEENATSRFNQHELAGFLHKPFTPEELRNKIQRVLGADKR
jgi:CheY-like chemotaxis protein/putative methionine-R-sulfoxide reductase with GAF domain